MDAEFVSAIFLSILLCLVSCSKEGGKPKSLEGMESPAAPKETKIATKERNRNSELGKQEESTHRRSFKAYLPFFVGSELVKSHSPRIWDGVEFKDYNFVVTGPCVTAYRASLVLWQVVFDDDVIGITGDLSGLTEGGEAFRIDRDTGFVQERVADFDEIMRLYVFVHKSLSVGDINSISGAVSPKLTIINDPKIHETGPLNVMMFRKKIHEEGVRVLSFGFDVESCVSINNAWSVLIFQKIEGSWMVTGGMLRPDL